MFLFFSLSAASVQTLGPDKYYNESMLDITVL